MDTNNPFNPSFGGKPQYFFGRTHELDIVARALANPNSPHRALFFTGNRGCGKTALLERLSRLASDTKWLCIDVHALNASETIVRQLVSGSSRTSEKTIEPTLGFAGASIKAGAVRTSTTNQYDATDLANVLLETCQSLKKHKGVFITVDEIQKIPEADMENLCAAVQMAMRKGMPVALMMAGLPGSKETVSSYKGCTFMKRVDDIHLDSLLISETSDAFRRLLELVVDAEATEGAIDELSRYSQGYPYLMQLIGYFSIQEFPTSTQGEVAVLDRNAVVIAQPLAYESFRANVLVPSIDGLSNEQRTYLYAMGKVMDDSGKAKTAAIAEAIGKSHSQLSPIRNRLLKKRVIVNSGYGFVRYNLPRMRQFFTDPVEFSEVDTDDVWLHE